MDLQNKIIDFDYIHDFQSKELEFNEFYKQKLDKINFNLYFINNKNIIHSISFESILYNNTITSENLIYLIKKYSNDKYVLNTIIIFNFNINNNEIKDFLNNKISISNYFTIYKNITDIYIDDTISKFKEINSIDIYLEKQIKIKNNFTKKIIFNIKNKTKRKK